MDRLDLEPVQERGERVNLNIYIVNFIDIIVVNINMINNINHQYHPCHHSYQYVQDHCQDQHCPGFMDEKIIWNYQVANLVAAFQER